MRKKAIALILMCQSLLMSGCLYVAPIEEEPEPEDTLPEIHAVSPSLGVVEFNLSKNDVKTFVLSTYHDENEGQALYHRLVMDFRPASSTADAITATKPIQVDPGMRDSISYQVDPCSMVNRHPDVFTDGKSLDLYLLLSDERFLHDSEVFVSTDFSLAFKTYTDRGAVFKQWTLLFKGECPSK